MESPIAQIEIIETEDGSNSLRRKDIEESYHSSFGALSETRLIFIDYALRHWCNENPAREVKILEIGFGTGLNAIASLNAVDRNIVYETLELYPLASDLAKRLNYGRLLSLEREFELMHDCDWEAECSIGKSFSLIKRHTRAETFAFEPNKYDIVYMDAFSPEKEPLLWTSDFFARLFAACKQGAVLTTYCCKGAVKRSAKSAGWIVEKLPGPKGKREVLRMRKPHNI